jgi:hypothetical protein
VYGKERKEERKKKSYVNERRKRKDKDELAMKI